MVLMLSSFWVQEARTSLSSWVTWNCQQSLLSWAVLSVLLRLTTETPVIDAIKNELASPAKPSLLVVEVAVAVPTDECQSPGVTKPSSVYSPVDRVADVSPAVRVVDAEVGVDDPQRCRRDAKGRASRGPSVTLGRGSSGQASESEGDESGCDHSVVSCWEMGLRV